MKKTGKKLDQPATATSLREAIHMARVQEAEELDSSVDRRSTEMAREFKAFIIQQQSAEVLELFAEKQLMQAKQQLYKARALFSSSQQLQQLNAFGDYLLLQERG